MFIVVSYFFPFSAPIFPPKNFLDAKKYSFLRKIIFDCFFAPESFFLDVFFVGWGGGVAGGSKEGGMVDPKL